MDFVAVFSFFSENVELTAQQRLAELICVTALFLCTALTLAVLLSRKIKKYRAAHSAPPKDEHPACHPERNDSPCGCPFSDDLFRM